MNHLPVSFCHFHIVPGIQDNYVNADITHHEISELHECFSLLQTKVYEIGAAKVQEIKIYIASMMQVIMTI